MVDFKKIFSGHGYSLFEPESVENAIVDALESREMRYILGIPIILENTEIDYPYLMKKANGGGVQNELLDVLSISSRIIRNRKKRNAIKEFIKLKKIKKKFDEKEFEAIYRQYSKAAVVSTFPADVHYQLSFLFTPRQIEILYKIKTGKRLTKTEKEYYSRAIKKRLVAIKELVDFAAGIVK
ncbi:MAG: hypothetical protein V1492_01640 [Candidatus Micrarchaeota archaeon]